MEKKFLIFPDSERESAERRSERGGRAGGLAGGWPTNRARPCRHSVSCPPACLPACLQPLSFSFSFSASVTPLNHPTLSPARRVAGQSTQRRGVGVRQPHDLAPDPAALLARGCGASESKRVGGSEFEWAKRQSARETKTIWLTAC